MEEPQVEEEPNVEEPQVEETPSVDEEPAASVSANFWDNTIDTSSDASIIAAFQQRLIDWGWLNAGDCTSGTLDDATIKAVISFQSYLNENGAAVEIVDESDPQIEVDTLKYLSDSATPLYFPG